jgi:hypothetical protein
MFGEYITSLLSPWRRVARAEFNIAMTLLSLPGFMLSLMGMMSSGGNMFSSLSGLAKGFQGGQGGLEGLVNTLGAPIVSATPVVAGPMVDVGGLLNGLLMLLFTPFVRGRLLDMGISSRNALILAFLVQASVLNGTIQSLTGAGVLPYGLAFGLLTFVAWGVLAVKASKARTVGAIARPGTVIRARDDDDYPIP